MECRVCDSTELVKVIDLGIQPWANGFLKEEQIKYEEKYPLEIFHCADCNTVQLGYTVKKEVMFSDHTYLSGMTKTLSDHFKEIAIEVDSRFLSGKSEKSVLDIGSNDGTQLKHFQDLGYAVQGVESSKRIAQLANEKGINTDNAFFNLDVAKGYPHKFDVINASGVFFHLEELHSVAEGINESLKDNGVFVIQALYLKNIVENNAFDQIYHEHLLYYTINTLNNLLNRHGMELFDSYIDPIHGGSIMGFAAHQGLRDKSSRLLKIIAEEETSKINDVQTYRDFAERIKEKKQENRAFLLGEKQKGKVIYGMGAPVKGNTLLNYFEIGPETIDYLVEINLMRKGMYSPGMHIPIAIESELKKLPDIYYVLSWNFKDEILRKNKSLIEKGVQFYFPINPK